MRILELLKHLYIIQFDVQELVDGFERASYGDIIFELDGDFVVHKGFEEAECYVSVVAVCWRRCH